MSLATVFLVDDHVLVRAGIRRILEASDEFEVVGEAGDSASAVEQVTQLAPAIVLMDIALPDGSGIEATRSIRDAVPDSHIVMLSQYDRLQYVEEALQAGASGYLLKTADAKELIAGLRSVLEGNRSLSPSVANQLAHRGTQSGKGYGSAARLTARENGVLRLVAEGLSSKEVAAKLNISPRTAETHRANLMNKLGVKNVAELIRYAVREGFVPP